MSAATAAAVTNIMNEFVDPGYDKDESERIQQQQQQRRPSMESDSVRRHLLQRGPSADMDTSQRPPFQRQSSTVGPDHQPARPPPVQRQHSSNSFSALSPTTQQKFAGASLSRPKPPGTEEFSCPCILSKKNEILHTDTCFGLQKWLKESHPPQTFCCCSGDQDKIFDILFWAKNGAFKDAFYRIRLERSRQGGLQTNAPFPKMHFESLAQVKAMWGLSNQVDAALAPPR